MRAASAARTGGRRCWPGPGSATSSLTIAVVHLSIGVLDNIEQERRLLDALVERPGPHLLLGDLNRRTAWVRPAAAARGLHLVDDDAPTAPRVAPRYRIDHVAVSGLVARAPTVVDTGASDHRALVVEVRGPSRVGHESPLASERALPARHHPWQRRPWPGRDRLPPGPARRSCRSTARAGWPATRCATPTPSCCGPPARSASRTSQECPICEDDQVVLVTYVFGPRLPAFGRCITTKGELPGLAKRPARSPATWSRCARRAPGTTWPARSC